MRGHSYQYLIQEYDLELLAGVGWCLLVVGVAVFVLEKTAWKRFPEEGDLS